MRVPDIWTLILLGLAAFRVFRLIAEDTILDPLRAKLLRLGNWQEGQKVPDGYRKSWAEFITCPWCAGFWVSLAWWGAWQAWPHVTLVAAAPWAISAVVGLIAHFSSEDED